MKYKRYKSKKLNLGCGDEYKEGWINMDWDSKWKTDILANMEKGIPLPDNSVDEIYVKHVLEHIDPRSFAFVLSEMWRVSQNGARIIIYCPYFSCSITYKTVDHISPISYYTFDDCEKFKVLQRKMFYFRESFDYKSKFFTIIKKILNPIFSFLPNLLPLIYERIFCWIFPMEEIKVILEVKK